MLKDKEFYINELNKYPEDDNLVYLIEKFCDNAGLFVRNKKILYLVKTEGEKIKSIKTEYLNMFSNVCVSPVTEKSNFSAGNYNIIEFNGKFDDVVFNSFLELCYIHSQNINSVKFVEFFNSLVNMFQIPHEQRYKDLLGFYGEILFLIKCKSLGYNIIDNWHKGEHNNCKYDLVFKLCNADIKTVISQELIVTLKHNQLFNSDKNYLILMQLEKNNSGKTLNELLFELKNDNSIGYNYKFWVKVEKEKLKISPRDMEEERFSFKNCFIYDTSAINPFPTIPLKVTEIKYDLDLIDDDGCPLDEYIKKLDVNKTNF